MKENECDYDFLNDSAMEEKFDRFIDLMRDRFEDEDKQLVINPLRVRQVLDTYRMMYRLLRATDAQVTWCLFEPFRSMGAVRINGSKMLMTDTKLFAEAIEAASNVEIFLRTDGTVQLDLTFHGLMKLPEGEDTELNIFEV